MVGASVDCGCAGIGIGVNRDACHPPASPWRWYKLRSSYFMGDFEDSWVGVEEKNRMLVRGSLPRRVTFQARISGSIEMAI